MATIHHPVSGLTAVCPDEGVPIYRRSGWITIEEHRENEARRAQLERERAEAGTTPKDTEPAAGKAKTSKE